MRKDLFITGTGTGVGKTVVTSLLAQGLKQEGTKCKYWKPVQTGDENDTNAVLERAGVECETPAFYFPLPASPDQAAVHAGQPQPTVYELLKKYGPLTEKEGMTLIEGAGGLLVPLNDQNETWADFIAQANLPVLVVAHSGLGTLNHTLLTLTELERRKISVVGVVLSGALHPANQKSLERARREVRFFSVGEVDFLGDKIDIARRAEELVRHISDHSRQRQPEAYGVESSQVNRAGTLSTTWEDAAAKHLWFPYTQHKTSLPPVPIVRAKGVWLETKNGDSLLDASSSWWVNNLGHGRPEIAQAIAAQQQTLDHVLLAGAVHPQASLLAKKLVELAKPPYAGQNRARENLSRVFFSDNGSTAVEVGIKMAFQFFANKGDEKRRLFVAFRGSYHGDTFGAMSTGKADGFHTTFAPLLFSTLVADPVTTHPSRYCPDGASVLKSRLDELERLVAEHADEVAGILLEPLVQGAGGMLVQPLEFVRGVAHIAKKFGVPLVLDEVFTGLGRFGENFAFQRAGIQPDIVACAKGLTGGALPLAATLAKDEIFRAFLSDDKSKALLHGHSFTGNPVACAAALTALDLAEKERLTERAMLLERRFQSWLETEGKRLEVQAGRAIGGLLAFELPASGRGDYFHAAAQRIPEVALKHGLLLRPLGNTVYFLPPLVISPDELEQGLAALTAVIREVALAPRFG